MDITIRRAEPSDYEAMYKILSGPRAVWGTLQLPYPSLEVWKKRLAEPPEGMYNLVACVNGEVVGNLALHTFPSNPRRKHMCGLGMTVRDDWQGKGVGTALMAAAIELVDKWLQIIRLELEVFVDNEPAIKLYTKFGFEVEGVMKCYAYRDGEYVDTLKMARLRPGWKP